jgi:hypothetical protein
LQAPERRPTTTGNTTPSPPGKAPALFVIKPFVIKGLPLP